MLHLDGRSDNGRAQMLPNPYRRATPGRSFSFAR